MTWHIDFNDCLADFRSGLNTALWRHKDAGKNATGSSVTEELNSRSDRWRDFLPYITTTDSQYDSSLHDLVVRAFKIRAAYYHDNRPIAEQIARHGEYWKRSNAD